MANRFPLIVNNAQQRLEEIPSGDSLNLSSTGIYDGNDSGSSNNILTSTGSNGVQWKSVGSILPTASASVLGGIKIGTGLSIDANGIVNVSFSSYTLPTASASVLGGIKVGTGLSINASGVLSVSSQSTYTLPTASASVLGGIKIGTGLSIDANGVLSANVSSQSTYTLPAASASTLGGIRVGTGLSVDANGVLSANASTISGLQSRSTASATSSSISAGESANIDITNVAKSYGLIKIQTSHAAWVTIYVNKASRTADASRSETTDPVPGSGILAEVITTGSATQIITPGIFAWSEDSGTNTQINSTSYSATDTVYVKVVNKGTPSASITVTLHYVKLEA